MEYVGRFIDLALIGSAIGLSFALKTRTRTIGLSVAALYLIFALHYQLLYPWSFVREYVVTIAIPLVMAWAGNHLAAEASATAREKTLWRSLFVLLTAVALGGSFWVLNDKETEHQKEILKMSGDMEDSVTGAIVRYNASHPQNQITSDQFAGLIGVVKGLGTSPPKRDSQPTGQPKATVSASELLSKRIDEIRSLCPMWDSRDRGFNEQIYDLKRDVRLPEPDRRAAVDSAQKSKEEEDNIFQDRLVHAVSDAKDLQNILLPYVKETEEDRRKKQRLGDLWNSDIWKNTKESWQCPRDLDQVADYLEMLAARTR